MTKPAIDDTLLGNRIRQLLPANPRNRLRHKEPSMSPSRPARSVTVMLWATLVSLPQLGLAETIAKQREPIQLTEKARLIHQSALVVDGHNDLPWELRTKGSPNFQKIDIAQPQPEMHTDIPRLRQGGVGAQFWSVFVPADTAYNGTALTQTLEQIELVRAMVRRYPESFEIALTAADVERIWKQGMIASLIGVEGGHAIENSLNVLRQLYEMGARYMTLTHSDSLDWADSATDDEKNNGLSPFGEEVVREMNRLGMLVDISHVSIPTMKHALRVTRAPVIFSHSSARAIADHPRNVPDDVLELTSRNGGLVMVNFFSGFVVPSAARQTADRMDHIRELEQKYNGDQNAVRKELQKWTVKHPLEQGTIHDVLDHIEHIIKIAGIDHVGLGFDYDGVPLLPTQLEDVSTYPYITQGLLDRGYGEVEIRKILGGNLLRVMRAAEHVAAEVSGRSEAGSGRRPSSGVAGP